MVNSKNLDEVRSLIVRASRTVSDFLGTSIEDIPVDFRENDSQKMSPLHVRENPIASYRVNKDTGDGKILVRKDNDIDYSIILHEIFHAYHYRKNPRVKEFDKQMNVTDRELNRITTLVYSIKDPNQLPDGMTQQQVEEKYQKTVSKFVENLMVLNSGIERIAFGGTHLLEDFFPYKRFLGETEIKPNPLTQRKNLWNKVISALDLSLEIPNYEQINDGAKIFGGIGAYLKSLVVRSYYAGDSEGAKVWMETDLNPQIELEEGVCRNDNNFYGFFVNINYPQLPREEARKLFLDMFYQSPLEISRQTLDLHNQENQLVSKFLKERLEFKI